MGSLSRSNELWASVVTYDGPTEAILRLLDLKTDPRKEVSKLNVLKGR